MMLTIDIAQVIGTPNAIIQKFGLQVFQETNRAISSGQKVLIDFSNLKNVTTGFFHAAIGNLVKEYGAKFYDLVELKGIDKAEWKEKLDDAINIASNPNKGLDIDQAISELYAS
jgi:hypothetical protein